jgi:hypothetical protein
VTQKESKLTRKTRYNPEIPQPERVLGAFRPGESLPIKGCWLKVAAVEPGILVLTLTGYTKAGLELLEQLKARANAEALESLAPEEGDLP